MVLPRRPIRHRPGTAPPTPVPGLLGDAASPEPTGWSLAVRARMLHLSGDLVEQDLADLGVVVPETRLRRVLLGVDPAEPVLPAALVEVRLAALVEVLLLRDRSLSHAQVVAAAAGPWLSAGHRVPPHVVQILCDCRDLPAHQVLGLATRPRARRAL